jgi:hypothetical protein
VAKESTVDEQQAAAEAKVKDLLAKLEAAEKRATALQEENEALQTGTSSGLKVRKDQGKPYSGESGGWLFKIEPLDKEKYPHLPTLTERACDESEMIRWYSGYHEDPPKSGKRVDIVKVKLKVTCVDKGRISLINHVKRLANIRQKLDAGIGISQADEAILAKHESEILGVEQESV